MQARYLSTAAMILASLAASPALGQQVYLYGCSPNLLPATVDPSSLELQIFGSNLQLASAVYLAGPATLPGTNMMILDPGTLQATFELPPLTLGELYDLQVWYPGGTSVMPAAIMVTPEPASLLLLGFAAIFVLRRRRR